MNSSFSLMCFALLLISPLCFGYTDEEREADSLKLAEIIRTSQDDDTKISRTQDLLDIYRRLNPILSPEEREKIENLIKEHTDEILVDGVPSQGGRKTKYAGKVLSPVAKGLATGFFEELGASLAKLFTG
ncbi:protein Turandot C-like [Drosophila subpulchrella]|uniref:protein Turandot C-like n=1 Tax=Drosophila subpulchrella TaxID=1486046 RepID=UPI0018A18BEA|nr:protein Turandot C-like [Drosophila subpulchrella]